MTEKNTLLSRRSVVKISSLGVAGAAVGGAGLLYGSRPAVAAGIEDEWAASDIVDEDRVESDDGSVEAVNTAPLVDLEWSNFADGAESADVTLTAHLRADDNEHVDQDLEDVVYDVAGISAADSDESVLEVIEEDGGFGSVNGAASIDIDVVPITDSEVITTDYFEDDDSSTENHVTTVELELEVTVNGAQTTVDPATAIATFDVEVENLREEYDAGGDANTSAE